MEKRAAEKHNREKVFPKGSAKDTERYRATQ
jgi:hypothetical protein